MDAEISDTDERDSGASDTDLHVASHEEKNERAVIGRLIRRLRISDSPQHFQTVATTVLRTSLEMAAVAWVPKDPHDAVVVSGAVPGLTTASYRGLSSPAGRESTLVFSDDGTANPPFGSAAVRRYASVAGGSVGWLVAINPLDDRPIKEADLERLQYVASLIATQLANARIYADLKGLLFGVIRGLTAAIDAKDPYTSGHSERVARIAARLGEELGMSSAQRSDLYLTGLLHDVGKIGIDDQVLKKNGPLTPDERRQIQSHVEIGVTILKDLKKLNHILPGVKHHHESLDGTGYPDQLAGTDIPVRSANPGCRRRLRRNVEQPPLPQADEPGADRQDSRGGTQRPVGPRRYRRPLRLPERRRGDPAKGAGRKPDRRRERHSVERH